MGNSLDIQKEILSSYTALERIKNLSKISAISIKSTNNEDLKIEDFEEVFSIIIELSERVEDSVSKLEALDN